MLNADDRPPETVGNFRVIRRLASGGTSDVLLARPIKPAGDHRPVVLKMLLPPYRDDPSFEQMLAREAEAYGRLHNPYIVQLFEVFAVRERLVIVLEYVDGLALNRLRAQLQGAGGWLEDRASAYLAWCLFSALAAAHGARDPETGQHAPVIHRDINPSNVLVPWDGRVKLADFSIAKVTGMSGGDTKTGITKGTFGYMAPEQVRGEKVTERSDVYTATLILWEQFARRKAIQYAALPEIEVMRAMAHPHLVSLDVLRPDLPEKIRRAVAVGLESDPARREMTAEDMVEILREFVPPDEGRRLLQDTLYRLREGDEEPGADRSWARMTPIAAPEAYNGALGQGERVSPKPVAAPAEVELEAQTDAGMMTEVAASPESPAAASGGVPAFPLEMAHEPPAKPAVERNRMAAPTPPQVIPMPALAIAPAPSDARDPQAEIETQLRPSPSTVSFSELLLPRSAEPVARPEGRESSSSVLPEEHQPTLQGGIGMMIAPPVISPAEPNPGRTSSPAVEETLVSPAPAGIPTPTSRSVPVQLFEGGTPPEEGRTSSDVRISDARGSGSDPRFSSDIRWSADVTGPLSDPPEIGFSEPDLSATMADRGPIRTGGELAATAPAIPSQMLGPAHAPPVIGPMAGEGGISRVPTPPGDVPMLHAPVLATASTTESPAKSRWGLWLAGALVLFVGGGLGAASFFQHGAASGPVTPEPAASSAPSVPAVASASAPAPSASAPEVASASAPPAASSAPAASAPAASAKPTTSSAPAASAPAASAAAAPSKPEKPEPAKGDTVSPGADTGTLVVERGGGHRLYLDGKVIGQGSGSHTAPCGKHTVRVGSDGRPQDLNIPCGGSVTVQ